MVASSAKFEIYFQQISCKKHFQFAVLWPLLPSTSCMAVFLGPQLSKRQEHQENVECCDLQFYLYQC